MIKNYNQILPGLEQDIINKINKLENRKLSRIQALYSISSLFLFIGAIISSVYLYQTISESGVYEYFSLIFYDFSMISYWKELLLSTTESLPFMELGISLSIISVFFWTLLKTSKIQTFKHQFSNTLAIN